MIGGHIGAEGGDARTGDFRGSLISAGEANARLSGAANNIATTVHGQELLHLRGPLEADSVSWKDAIQGLLPPGGNHGVSADCAHPGGYPNGSAGAAEKGALLVGATGDSLGALEGGDALTGVNRGSHGSAEGGANLVGGIRE